MDELDASDALFPTVNSREWLDVILRHRCKVAKVRPFQLDLGMEIVRGKDVWCIIATGMGKTVALQTGAIAADARGECGICLIIVPTKVLVEQQAEVATARGLRALAINEDMVREAALVKRDLWLELTRGDDVRVAIMTPQMVQGRRMQELLNSPAFVDLVRWVSIDEAGLVDQKEGVFAAPYLRLSMLRVKLNDSTVWVAVTATATTERAPIMARNLASDREDTLTGVTQLIGQISNIYHVSFSMLHHDYLDDLIPREIPNRSQLIKLYNGLMTGLYRRNLKRDFELGKVRVIVVTDTAAYGFDVANVRRVVTTELEKYYEEAEQKYGRAGRDGELAEVIAFAPPWVQNLPPGSVPLTKTQHDEEEKRSHLLDPPAHGITFNASPQSAVGQFTIPTPVKMIWHESGNGKRILRGLRNSGLREWSGQGQMERFVSSTSLCGTLNAHAGSMEPPNVEPNSAFKGITVFSHLCTDLENLKTIAKRWEYFEQCGAVLLKFLVESMTGFDEIYYDLTRAERSDVDVTPPMSEEAQKLSRYTTVAILKVLCRENGCQVRITTMTKFLYLPGIPA
ncbi:P-loop containing nucleoside triphosphate hydrolase protein [Mycena leptocephala]|nr:P-loop containing nucleoside triphosphate hydrolase protein [Mycena leptocephala]